tara:strand:+ start:635 stop:1075 length:441 start_codon:yes stop_codon:yes gene_type:complete
MAYKMKGPSLYKNGALGKNLKVQKDYSGQKDGRATSSPLQQLIPQPPPQMPAQAPVQTPALTPIQQKVDPDAPGTPGMPGYEPPVKRSDLDAKGKAIWDRNHAKKKKKETKSGRETEGQDENKIFDNNGNHVGNYVNGEKVMLAKK